MTERIRHVCTSTNGYLRQLARRRAERAKLPVSRFTRVSARLLRIWHTRTCKLGVILALFGLAFHFKGEPITTTTLIGRVFDAVGDVAADATFHPPEA